MLRISDIKSITDGDIKVTIPFFSRTSFANKEKIAPEELFILMSLS